VADTRVAEDGGLEDIDDEVARLESLVARTSEITDEYRALEREEVILQEEYTGFLRKLKSAELARSMETAQKGAQLVRLEAALPSTSPIVPRIAYTAGAFLAALGASLGLAILHEMRNPVVIDAAHLERITGLPALGSIPPVV